MDEPRICLNPNCDKVLVRRDAEPVHAFGVRRYCGRSCASKHGQRASSHWTVERVRAVRRACLAGKTTGQIAAQMRADGMDNVTRNAVIGLITRRNLRRPATGAELRRLGLSPGVEGPAKQEPAPNARAERIERELVLAKAKAKSGKPRFACAYGACRNTRQPGREHCAEHITLLHAAEHSPRAREQTAAREAMP